jgi:hypothetical protein
LGQLLAALKLSDLPTPSPPAEKATASQDQARKASTCDGGGDTTGDRRTGDRRIVVGLKAAKGDHPYVYLDGIVLKRSWAGEVRNVSLLVAIGVNERGYREILGICD